MPSRRWPTIRSPTWSCRVIAGVVMFPVVVAFGMAVGMLTGWLAATTLLPLSTAEFFRGVRMFYQHFDWQYGLIKSASFGLTVTVIGCFLGLQARGGAEGVGSATTRTVVYSAAMILVLGHGFDRVAALAGGLPPRTVGLARAPGQQGDLVGDHEAGVEATPNCPMRSRETRGPWRP